MKGGEVMKVIVILGSITTATRLTKILKRKMGIASSVIHTPAQLSGGGCSYSVKSDSLSLPYIRKALDEYGIRPR